MRKQSISMFVGRKDYSEENKVNSDEEKMFTSSLSYLGYIFDYCMSFGKNLTSKLLLWRNHLNVNVGHKLSQVT